MWIIPLIFSQKGHNFPLSFLDDGDDDDEDAHLLVDDVHPEDAERVKFLDGAGATKFVEGTLGHPEVLSRNNKRFNPIQQDVRHIWPTSRTGFQI